MLGAQGIIPAEDADAIDAGLARIAGELGDGDFAFRPGDEDIHTAVERRLIELVGDAGRRLHTARSRNDQVITDTLLLPARAAARRRRDAARARRGAAAPRPRPTSTRSCPATRTASAPSRCGSRTTCSPTSGCSTATARGWATRSPPPPSARWAPARSPASGFPIDRDGRRGGARLRRGPRPNSLDAVGSRDALVDYLHFAAQLGVHLSRLGAEIVLWAGEEGGFVELDDAFTSGSSMLPQKKNPDAAELARAKAPRLIADLSGLLGVLAGLPLAYNKDLQEDKVYLFDADRHPGADAARDDRHDRHRGLPRRPDGRGGIGRLPGRDRPRRPPRPARLAVPARP